MKFKTIAIVAVVIIAFYWFVIREKKEKECTKCELIDKIVSQNQAFIDELMQSVGKTEPDLTWLKQKTKKELEHLATLNPTEFELEVKEAIINY